MAFITSCFILHNLAIEWCEPDHKKKRQAEPEEGRIGEGEADEADVDAADDEQEEEAGQDGQKAYAEAVFYEAADGDE